MKRLTTRYERAGRVADVFGASVCIAVFVALSWWIATDGWVPFIIWLGILAACGFIIAICALVNRWIDTGRWFR